jgi:hypothetical protein
MADNGSDCPSSPKSVCAAGFKLRRSSGSTTLLKLSKSHTPTAKVHQVEYSKPLHPGTFVSTKRGCLKPTFSCEDVRSPCRGSSTAALSSSGGLNHSWHNSTSLKDLCSMDKECASFDMIKIPEKDGRPGENPSIPCSVSESDCSNTSPKTALAASLNSGRSSVSNLSKSRVCAANSAEVHQVEYSRPLHPGTFATPKRGCLKPTFSCDDLWKSSSTSALSSSAGLNHTWHNSTSLKDLCSKEKMSSGCSSSAAKKSVSFDIIKIREYDRQPGDNPSVSRGAPVSLGWNVIKEDLCPVDEYEKQVGVTRERREKHQLHLSHLEREELLVDWGYSMREILGASQQSVKDKNQRRKNSSRASNRSLFLVDFMVELTGRRLTRAFRSSTKKDFEELLSLTEARNASVLERRALRLSEQQSPENSSTGLPASTLDAVDTSF